MKIKNPPIYIRISFLLFSSILFVFYSKQYFLSPDSAKFTLFISILIFVISYLSELSKIIFPRDYTVFDPEDEWNKMVFQMVIPFFSASVFASMLISSLLFVFYPSYLLYFITASLFFTTSSASYYQYIINKNIGEKQ